MYSITIQQSLAFFRFLGWAFGNLTFIIIMIVIVVIVVIFSAAAADAVFVVVIRLVFVE